jgi:hypothetical protein
VVACCGVQFVGRLASPIPYPALVKDPHLGAQWKAKVMAWPEWDRLLCCHLQPVVDNGRQQLQQCYTFVDQAAGQGGGN